MLLVVLAMAAILSRLALQTPTHIATTLLSAEANSRRAKGSALLNIGLDGPRLGHGEYGHYGGCANHLGYGSYGGYGRSILGIRGPYSYRYN